MSHGVFTLHIECFGSIYQHGKTSKITRHSFKGQQGRYY